MRLLAVTACPTGIAHTYMAAEALKLAAEELGHEIKVETRGAVGIENVITDEDLSEAVVVIIAADTSIDKSKFADMKILEISTREAIRNPKEIIQQAVEAGSELSRNVKVSSDAGSRKGAGATAFKHLMTGLSYMVPFMIAGAVLYYAALSLGFTSFNEGGKFVPALKIAGEAAFQLAFPVLSGYIAYSIGSTPAMIPGMVGGFLMEYSGGGFLGVAVIGFIAGYTVLGLKKYIKLPKSVEGFHAIFLIPVLSIFVTGVLAILLIAGHARLINNSILEVPARLNVVVRIILGVALGAMMAYDMGGPVNKAAYIIGVATVTLGQPSLIMAAVMAAGMVPPLGMAFAVLMGKSRFPLEERKLAGSALLMGLCFITEGAVPFAKADPKKVVPSIVAGSAIAGGMSMIFNCGAGIPQGGVFTLLIPGMIQNSLLYAMSILTGSIFTAVIVVMLKKSGE